MKNANRLQFIHFINEDKTVTTETLGKPVWTLRRQKKRQIEFFEKECKNPIFRASLMNSQIPQLIMPPNFECKPLFIPQCALVIPLCQMVPQCPTPPEVSPVENLEALTEFNDSFDLFPDIEPFEVFDQFESTEFLL